MINCMVIDAHTHIGDPSKGWSPGNLIKSMDEAGIDLSLVIAENLVDPESHTDKVLEACAQNSRLKAIGCVDFTSLDRSQIDHLLELLEKKLILGVKFYTGYEDYHPANEKLFPIYEYCQSNNFPVVFHTGALEEGEEGFLKYSHPLVFDDVAQRFPKLKIVLAHMGNPWLLDCAAVMGKNENVYADVSGYFEENSPIIPEEIEVFKNVLKEAWLFLGSYKKFIFGTDWPLYSQKEYLEAVQAIEMTDEEKELVFWKNANMVYNLGL
jgi:predicted TIM-barrel fold metal-dependent hydrolase